MQKLINLKRWYPSLQSIRGASVIAVVLFHLNEELFSGGFLGVDIFFTISGFVVLNSVLNKCINGEFSLKQFIYKRFIRLQPAALFCIIISLLLATFFILPFGYKSSFLGGFFSSFGLMNLWLLRISQDYFATPSDHNLFMQFWSLSIEEQYYFIFGILMTIASIFKKRSVIDFSLFFLVTLSILCFILSKNSFSHPFVYFNPLTRIWEISIGALALSLADRFLKLKNFINFSFIKKLFSFFDNLNEKISFEIILLLFLIPLIFLGQATKFWVLTLTLITTLYLFILRVFDGYNLERNHKIICDNNSQNFFRPVTYLEKVGEISYSIYLWHWPIFYFFKLYFPIYYSNPLLSYIFLMAFVLFIGHLSHRYLELHFKNF